MFWLKSYDLVTIKKSHLVFSNPAVADLKRQSSLFRDCVQLCEVLYSNLAKNMFRPRFGFFLFFFRDYQLQGKEKKVNFWPETALFLYFLEAKM